MIREPIRPVAGALSALLLGALLLGAPGCGRPSGEEGASPATNSTAPNANPNAPATSLSMSGSYEDTGLPMKFELNGKSWEIQQEIEAPEGSYQKASEQYDGKPLYHDPRATPPYSVIYLRVPKSDRYLQYAPAGG